MAMQSGIGLSKIIILAGAGYTGTILLKNGKLSGIIGELQTLVKGIEKSGEHSDGDLDYSDAIAQQVKRLAMEVRQMASAKQITVLNGGSGSIGNLSGFILPAAALGVAGYGYMWWKGLKFTDLMYVTKRNMATAVSNLTKHLEQVTEALSAAKAHLTQRIQHLDDKMENQKELSKAIQHDVNVATENMNQIDYELKTLQHLVTSLDMKMDTMEEKQELANVGVMYLCNFVASGGKKMRIPKALEGQLKPSERTRRLLPSPEVPSLVGLKEIADNLGRAVSEPKIDGMQDGIDIVEDQLRTPRSDQPRTLQRINSSKVDRNV